MRGRAAARALRLLLAALLVAGTCRAQQPELLTVSALLELSHVPSNFTPAALEGAVATVLGGRGASEAVVSFTDVSLVATLTLAEPSVGDAAQALRDGVQARATRSARVHAPLTRAASLRRRCSQSRRSSHTRASCRSALLRSRRHTS